MSRKFTPLLDGSEPLPPTATALAALAGVSIEALNDRCFCIGLDRTELRTALESTLGLPGLFELVRERCPHLFAAHPVFVAPAQLRRMAEVVQAIETVVALPSYREAVLARAPAIARHDLGGQRGVFFGFDFHVEETGFGLIEINTNAGGAMLNAVVARAQRACCPSIEQLLPPSAPPRAAAPERVRRPRRAPRNWRRGSWRCFAASGRAPAMSGRCAASPSSTRRPSGNTSTRNSCCSNSCSSARAGRR